MTIARRLGPLALALVAAVGLLAAPPTAADVRAAAPDLTIVGDARYEVQPESRRVVVTVDLVLKNTLRDTVTTRYYFDSARLAILPGSTGHRLTWSGSGTPSVRVFRRAADFTVVQMNLARRLYGGQTARYTLRFFLEDGGGSANRDVRIGGSLAAFPVWAFATDSTPGGSATVLFPEGFAVEVATGDLPPPTVDAEGRTILRSGRLTEPLDFFAYLVGDRPGAYVDLPITTTVGSVPVSLTIRSWPEDPEWADRVGDLVARALPALGTEIGLPWPRTDGLIVQETVSRSTGGYVGLFDPTAGLVEVAYYADDFVVLHEAAHAWFNGALLVDRWANEAFASYYAVEIADALGVDATGDELTDELRAVAIPLNAWQPIGREEEATEDYAYAATLELARLIAERAGPGGLRAVWDAAGSSIGAYQPPDAPAGSAGTASDRETVAGVPDWRGLLDLLEDRTGAGYDDLWRTWVVRPEDEPLLDSRAATRARYDAALAEAEDWALPRPIRDALRAWRFAEALVLLDEADEVLGRRDALDRAAAAAGLESPPTLRAAFEGDDGFADALAEADAQSETIDRYEEAVASRPVEPDVFDQLGLWGTDPEADLAAAGEAFEAGDLADAVRAADRAKLTWTDAPEIGRGRVIGIVTGILAVLLGLALLVAVWRRRRRRARALAVAAAAPGWDARGATAPTEDDGSPEPGSSEPGRPDG